MQLQNIVHKSIFFFCKLKLYIYLAAIYHRSQAVLNSFYTVVPTTSLPYYTIVNSKYTFAQWDKNGKIYLYSAGGHSKKKNKEPLIRGFCKIFSRCNIVLLIFLEGWTFCIFILVCVLTLYRIRYQCFSIVLLYFFPMRKQYGFPKLHFFSYFNPHCNFFCVVFYKYGS